MNEFTNGDREVKKIPQDTYMYNKLKVPGVLIECGFLSNPEEEKLLLEDEYQNKLAWGIYNGIIDYFYE